MVPAVEKAVIKYSRFLNGSARGLLAEGDQLDPGDPQIDGPQAARLTDGPRLYRARFPLRSLFAGAENSSPSRAPPNAGSTSIALRPPTSRNLPKRAARTVKLSVIRHEKIYVISTVLSPRKMKITVESGTVFPPHIGGRGENCSSHPFRTRRSATTSPALSKRTPENSVTESDALLKEDRPNPP